jgi:hypothetical protein
VGGPVLLCRRFDKDGLKAKLRWASAETLSEELKETLKKVLETNMAEVYAEDWVKAKTVKEKEMVEDDARYLFVYDVSSSDKEALAGFIQYRSSSALLIDPHYCIHPNRTLSSTLSDEVFLHSWCTAVRAAGVECGAVSVCRSFLSWRPRG